jgi:hypothetical protein
MDYTDKKTRKHRLPKPECDWLCYSTVALVGVAIAIIIFEAIV